MPLIPSMESLLCIVLLLMGSVGLFVLFVFTDNDAVAQSKLPQHATEKRDEQASSA